MDKERYVEFNIPSYVYLAYDSIEKLTLRKSGTVYALEHLGLMSNNYNIYSPVSGKILGTKKLKVLNNEVNTLVVENDYKDKCSKIKTGEYTYDYYKRKEANEIFDTFNINGKFNGKKFLMIDLTIKNNYLENKYIVSKYNYEILETIDAILKIFNINVAYIAVNNQAIQNMLENYSGIYPNIKFVSRVITNEYSVLYNGYDVIKIYNALKFNRYYNIKYVTVVNKKETIVVKTKVNILSSELIRFLKLDNNNVTAITYLNEKINNYDGILTSNIKAIIVN
jgi:hypothetical protein